MPANIRHAIARHYKWDSLSGLGQRWRKLERAMEIEYIAREPPAQVQKGGRFDPEGSNRQSNFRLFPERKNYVVQTRMRLAKGLISLKPTSFSQPIDDAQRRFHALALCIVNDSRTISTSMHAQCDWRVNFSGMWGHVRLRRDTSGSARCGPSRPAGVGSKMIVALQVLRGVPA